MTRLRYGPRFSQHGAGGYKYNESLANDMHRLNQHMAGIAANIPQYKRELVGHKNKLRKTKQREASDEGRHEAEVRMVEAVNKCVEMLEFHMEAMMQHRPMIGQRTLVNQIALHNAIYHLRCKCGIKFDASAYDHALHADRMHKGKEPDASIDDEQRRDDRAAAIVEGMMRQREARARNYRMVAERLIARAKK